MILQAEQVGQREDASCSTVRISTTQGKQGAQTLRENTAQTRSARQTGLAAEDHWPGRRTSRSPRAGGKESRA